MTDSFWWGVLGTSIGSAVTLAGQFAKYCWELKRATKFDNDRKAMLRNMLDSPGPTGWRNMQTLSNVIGTRREDTARLLIELGARASETGNDTWSYISINPLPNSD